MKAKLLKRLRRKAARFVRADWNGYEMTIAWRSPFINQILDDYECIPFRYNGDGEFYKGLYKVYNNIGEIRGEMDNARRTAVLEMLKDYRDDKIKSKIKKL